MDSRIWLRLLIALCWAVGYGGCWWPFGAEEKTREGEESSSGALETVPFEISSAEQKFLMEAQEFLDLPSLERCQFKVVSRLRQSCEEMGEEGLGKMSVSLLNCQSQAEERPTYTCTDDMSLADCTRAMDANTWNAYHIISNRARSVCYATRQQQFRRQTEHAVNQLSLSMHEQLTAVQVLASGHEQIQELAKDSVETLHKQQEELATHQHSLLSTHESMRERIATNLEQLAQEKVLIHSGQEQIASVTNDIRQQLEEATEVLGRYEASQRSGHDRILEDVSAVRHSVKEVWERIDNSTAHLLDVLEEIGGQYDSTLENLQRINTTISSMLSLVTGMNSAITSQLDWLTGQLGGTQRGLHVLTTIAAHGCFLLLATLCVLFVRAPGFSRAALLVIVVGNAAAELKLGSSLTLPSMAALELSLLVGNWLWLWWIYQPQSKASPLHLLPPSSPLPPPPHKHVDESSCEEDSYPSEEVPLTPYKRSEEPLTPHKFTEAPPTPLRVMKSGRGSPFPTRQCSALTRSGMRCRLAVSPGSPVCFRHSSN